MSLGRATEGVRSLASALGATGERRSRGPVPQRLRGASTGRSRRQLLAAGVAGGFGSVFGTPVARAVFGLEFIVLVGSTECEALVPALVTPVISSRTARTLGIEHMGCQRPRT